MGDYNFTNTKKRQVLHKSGSYCNGVLGSGNARSLAFSEQNSLTLSNKYHCRSSERPGELIIGSNWYCDGFQFLSLRILIFFSMLSLETLTKTDPECSAENLK